MGRKNKIEKSSSKLFKRKLNEKKNSSTIDFNKRKIFRKGGNTAKTYFESIGIQPEIIELLGSHEIAPETNLSDVIVDLVETGNTLKQNNLNELNLIRNISTRLIVNKASLVTNKALINKFKEDLISRL